MPIQYSAGSVAEHRRVRASCGLFDVSHMARFIVRGNEAGAFLNSMITSNLAKLGPMESTYGLLCRKDGGVIDDLFVYRLEHEWLVVANAANAAQDFAWLQDAVQTSVQLEDVTEQQAMIAFQGPRAVEILDSLSDGKAGALPRFGSGRFKLCGVECLVGRTGYTGEDGAEIFAPAAQVESVWEGILDHAGQREIECGPVGLAARDSLRFEPGFPLYGHELSDEWSPLPARLKWACDLNGEFVGADAIRSEIEHGLKMKLATVRMVDRGVPRQGQAVFAGETETGTVASGMYAPTIDAYCANVFVEPRYAVTGTELTIAIRDREKRAVVVKRPLYVPAYR